ncbi:glycoside hydrolase family 47 protein [Podospora didyma]|uniref:alpha-1,2-Mannosidase n=1 Tax=Podospora didyma TaxID=330526 RepID=A0AAE0K642_9PEZI|nr:glycoside hydrolase family 47 protein [Podospora didyma]
MLGVARRRTWAYIFAVIVIFFIVSLRRNLDTHGFPPLSALNPADGLSHSRWSRMKPKYPVKSMRQLPTQKPQALPKVQKSFPEEADPARIKRLKRQKAVKEAFQRCWGSYRTKAWMSDELTPISGGRRDTFGGWGATLVDSLDTLWIMGMKKEFKEAVDAASNINFDGTTLEDVNIFETNIRYLGGFLSAYDLSGDKRLLEKAREVGEMLYAAFDTPNRMPLTRWKLHSAIQGQAQVAEDNVLLAEIGSFSLEFIRLSLLTGDPKWFDAAQRIAEVMHEQQASTRLPGMWPVVVSARQQAFNKHSEHTLGAMADSMYEYLPKTHALVGGLLPIYREMYEASMDTAIKYALYRPMLPDEKDVLLSGMVVTQGKDDPKLQPEGQHLVCFAGGMLALGGRLVENQTHVDKGEKLMEGCVWAYKAMPNGIMPETFSMLPCASPDECPWNETMWKQAVLGRTSMDGDPELTLADKIITSKRLPKGFTDIRDTRYILRPEAIESVFILYRITGRADLLESAWDMWTAIDDATRTELANSAVNDITVTDEKPPQSDSMESFWLGETLKYFYLIFSEPDHISLDEYVFNTEAHPFKRLLP